MGVSIVIGAGGGIGLALTQHWLQAGLNVVAISRKPSVFQHPNLQWLIGASCEADIEQLLRQLQPYKGDIDSVVITTGTLHGVTSDGKDYLPEKRLEDVNAESMLHTLQVNSVLPALWVAKLLPLLKRKQCTPVAVLSARVGSIDDNRLGGWYSYRTSKAALNMWLKTAAIEFARRAGNVKLLAFHPGTTDTSLSKPFQANVAQEKLFSAEFVAKQLSDLMASLQPDGQLSYLDWQGKSIAW